MLDRVNVTKPRRFSGGPSLTTVGSRSEQPPRSAAVPQYAEALLVGTIAWGAFAFGSVYPWAYRPLAASVVIVALASLLAPAAPPASLQRLPALHLGRLAAGLALVAGVVAVQLVPVPLAWLRIVSSHAVEVVRVYDMTLSAHPDRHALSIAPRLTATGLALFGSFALLVVGSARLITIRGPRGLAHAIAIIGALLALTGIIQKAHFTGKIYGFWTPQMGGDPFGPFVNKNHFAGWMLMALPVSLGLLCGAIAKGRVRVKPTFRDRMLWLSSPDASRLVLLGGGAAVMALSLVLTMSRSGISAMMLALAATGVVALRRQGTTRRRTIVTSYLVLLVVMVTAWVGVDTIVGRFASADWSEFNNRRGAWADAADIFTRFPLVGTGLNTYGVATLFYQQHDLAQHYAQAHNDYLQLAAEGGLLLLLPAAACLVAFMAAVRQRFKEDRGTSGYWIRVGAVTGLAAMALQETVDFSLQMPGNAVLFAVLCGIALHGSPARNNR
jgi:putative inorganic carbon (HCO3(-)) transporter